MKRNEMKQAITYVKNVVSDVGRDVKRTSVRKEVMYRESQNSHLFRTDRSRRKKRTNGDRYEKHNEVSSHEIQGVSKGTDSKERASNRAIRGRGEDADGEKGRTTAFIP